jgi:hypothetical protein
MLLLVVYSLVICAACLHSQAQALPINREASQGSIKFLDDFCASVKCKETDLFSNWNFTKTSAGLYAVSPCQDPNEPVSPVWQFITCTWPDAGGATSTPANITAIQFTATSGLGLPLRGTIPDTINALVGLQQFIFKNQNLYGKIPAQIGELTNLLVLNVENNHLSGLPEAAELSKLTKLSQLRLTQNFFHGTLPGDVFAALPLLSNLGLGRNVFSGPIPAAIGSLSLLSDLELFDNRLVGPLPSFLSGMTQISRLDLQGNSLSSSILPSLNNLTKLKILNLARNLLSGSIPQEI